MERLATEQSTLETQLADPALYATDGKEKLKSLLQNKSAVDQQIVTAEEQWMEAIEALEELEQGSNEAA